MAAARYTVIFNQKQLARFRRSAPPAVVRTAEQVIESFLSVSPEDRIAAGGRLKGLHGRHRDLLQYDLPSGYRIWYRVDRDSMMVHVEYIGPHP